MRIRDCSGWCRGRVGCVYIFIGCGWIYAEAYARVRAPEMCVCVCVCVCVCDSITLKGTG